MHLTLEELARLVDEAPTPGEAGHLRDCLVCRRELAGLREQTASLASLAEPHPVPDAWPVLEAALRGEGLIRPQPARRRRVVPVWLRAAAAVLVVAGGAALLRRDSGPRVEGSDSPAPAAEGGERVLAAMGTPPAPVAGTDGAEAPLGEPVVRTVSNDGSVPAAAPRRRMPAPPTPQGNAAARELAEAETAYVAALRRYAEIADPASGADPQTRLAALETLVESTGRALERAPGDPVLNGYHLAVVNERDALRRQIDRAQQSAWY